MPFTRQHLVLSLAAGSASLAMAIWVSIDFEPAVSQAAMPGPVSTDISGTGSDIPYHLPNPTAAATADFSSVLPVSGVLPPEEVERRRHALNERVEALAKTMTDLRWEFEFADDEPWNPDGVLRTGILTMRTSRPVRLGPEELQKQEIFFERLRADLDRLLIAAEASDDNPQEYIEILKSMGIADDHFFAQMQRLPQSIAQERELEATGASPNDPRLQSLRQQNDVFRRQFREQRDSIARAQKVQLEIEAAQLAVIRESAKSYLSPQQALEKYRGLKREYLTATAQLAPVEQQYQLARLTPLPPERTRDWRLAARAPK